MGQNRALPPAVNPALLTLGQMLLTWVLPPLPFSVLPACREAKDQVQLLYEAALLAGGCSRKWQLRRQRWRHQHQQCRQQPVPRGTARAVEGLGACSGLVPCPSLSLPPPQVRTATPP